MGSILEARGVRESLVTSQMPARGYTLKHADLVT